MRKEMSQVLILSLVLFLSNMLFKVEARAAQIYTPANMSTLLAVQVMYEINKPENAQLKQTMVNALSGGRTDSIFFTIRALGLGMVPVDAPRAYTDKLTVGLYDIWRRSITYGYVTQKNLMRTNITQWRKVFLQWVVTEVSALIIKNPTSSQKYIVIFDQSVARNIVLGINSKSSVAMGQFIDIKYRSFYDVMPKIQWYVPYPPLIAGPNMALTFSLAWPDDAY